jgi:hypothetical protein
MIMEATILKVPESQQVADSFLQKVDEAIRKSKGKIVIKVMSDNYPEVVIATYILK